MLLRRARNSRAIEVLLSSSNAKVCCIGSQNGWFFMIANFYQKFLPKSKILISQAHFSAALNLCLKVFTKLRDSSFKNTKFSDLSGGNVPLRQPLFAPKLTTLPARGGKKVAHHWSYYNFKKYSFCEYVNFRLFLEKLIFPQ